MTNTNHISPSLPPFKLFSLAISASNHPETNDANTNTIADARQHCDALIKEEIDEPPRNDASQHHRAGILEPDRAAGSRRRGRDHEQNGLDCTSGSRHQLQQQQQQQSFYP